MFFRECPPRPTKPARDAMVMVETCLGRLAFELRYRWARLKARAHDGLCRLIVVSHNNRQSWRLALIVSMETTQFVRRSGRDEQSQSTTFAFSALISARNEAN